MKAVKGLAESTTIRKDDKGHKDREQPRMDTNERE
jgi:hypothetical protein